MPGIDIRKAKDIEVALITPNDYNPNVVKEETMELLRKSIKRDGFLQPILIRVDPLDEKRYIIIDGYHRHKVMSEFNEKTIPAIIVEKDDPLSKVATISMNKLRGNFDSIQLAEVLVELRKTYSDAEIADYLGYTKEELDSYNDLLDFNFDDMEESPEEVKALEDLVNEAAANTVTDFLIKLNAEQLAVVQSAIKDYKELLGGDDSNALHQICFSFIGEHGSDNVKKQFGLSK